VNLSIWIQNDIKIIAKAMGSITNVSCLSLSLQNVGRAVENGHWSLVIGHWSLVIGHWSLVISGCMVA
jgi:hypothetical protein